MSEEKIDYRNGQKVICTFEIEDNGQDFFEVDLLQNGVVLGNSVIFSNGRLSLLGVGKKDGTDYYSDIEILQDKYPYLLKLKSLYIYVYETGTKKPRPWESKILNYKIVDIRKPVKPNRFLIK